jgi:copper chaperone
MHYDVKVENIKCGGCASTIRSKITDEIGVDDVEVNIDDGVVTIQGDENHRDSVVARLAQLGYPEVGSVEGMKAATAKAKSFVSCAIGRIENSNS